MDFSRLLRRISLRPRQSRRLTATALVLEQRCLPSATANLVAYRPVTANINSSQFSVSETDETSSRLGPGIRVNGDDDNANGQADFLDITPAAAADNDLVRVDTLGSGDSLVVSWTGSLVVWTTASKTAAVVNGGAVTAGLSLWVEYASAVHTAGDSTQLQLTATEGVATATDTVVFHSFQSVVIAIGGFSQSPSGFGDPNLGIYTVAGALYRTGYDVQLFSHDQVQASGQGAAYNEVVSAVLNRNVDTVGVIGYSWGGGATYELSSALSLNAALPAAGYRLAYTAAIDGIKHLSLKSETRKPIGTAFHDNFYQRKDVLLKGNSVSGASNLNVSSTSWGKKLKHTTIDDSPTLQALLVQHLTARLVP